MSPEKCDVLVAGGSVAGLLVARELAARGVSVIVLEEDHEIGTPEHCSGVVSVQGLNKLGIIPDSDVIQNFMTKAQISCLLTKITLNAENQNVAVVDRRLFDKQIAKQAQNQGAVIRTRSAFRKITENGSNAIVVKTSDGELRCNFVVDARGIGSLVSKNKDCILPSAQFEIYADWISGINLEVCFDSDLYPGFFAWVIPIEQGKAKVGVAGRGINAAEALKKFIESRGEKCAIIRKVFAPIWVGGPINSFVEGNVIKVGDSAGQTKPTTAGGIFSCGMAGILAGEAISRAITQNNPSELQNYDKNWRRIFQNEFNKLLVARKILERLDNRALDEIFKSLSNLKLNELARTGDFDFHSSALSLIFGSGIAIGVTKGIIGNEIRKILGRHRSNL